MKKINILTLSALLLLPFAIYQSYIEYHLVAEATAVVALIFVSIDNNKITSRFQHISLPLVAIVLGGIVEMSIGGLPFFGVAIFLSVIGVLSRMVFIKTFSYARFKFFELIVALIVGGLVAYKLIDNIDKWYFFFPAYIAFVLTAMQANTILMNAKMMQKGVDKGYKAEVGLIAPDFMLPDQFGNIVRLADYYTRRHVLLIFVRGDWCPYCHMIMRTYMRESDKFKEKNIMLIAIGPDPVGINREMAVKLGLDYKVLSDDKMKVAQEYGIRLPDYNLPGATKHEEGMPLPASFLIDKAGTVRYTSRTERVGEFLNPRLIFPIVETLN